MKKAAPKVKLPNCNEHSNCGMALAVCWKLLCTPGLGVILWGESPPVSEPGCCRDDRTINTIRRKPKCKAI